MFALVAAALLPAALPAAGADFATRLHCATDGGSRYVPKVAPSRCTVFGPRGTFGGGVNLARIRWTSWGGATARGRGIERGFHLPYSKIAVTITAYRRKSDCVGHPAYTRLRVKSRFGTTRVRLARCRRAVR